MNLSGNLSGVPLIPKGPDDGRFYIFVNISISICALTSFLISALITIIIRERSLRTGSGILILHQLIVELQQVAIHWPVFIWMLATSQYKGIAQTVTFCIHYQFSYMITVTASLWGLAFLALNRFVAIFFPFSYNRFVSRTALAIMITMTWIIGIATHLPFYFGVEGGFAPVPPSGICSFAKPAVVYNLTNIPRTYLPLALSACFYVLVFGKVGYTKWHRIAASDAPVTNNLNTSKRGTISESYQNRVTMARILFINALAHCICFLAVPIGVSAAPALYQREPLYRNWLRTVFFIGYLSTPVLLLAMSKIHRDSLVRMVYRHFRPNASIIVPSRDSKPRGSRIGGIHIR